jgi:hypothetical protein
VNADLRDILRRLKDTAPFDFDPARSIAEARDFIVDTYQHDNNNHNKIVDAIAGLDKAAECNLISTFNETEDRIFAYVWERCSYPKNASNRLLMREAVINSLADGTENGSQVCINGRCARMLNSLVTLDYDSAVAGSALTMEAIRNQIFQEMKTIVNNAIIDAKNSSDELMRVVGESYETGEGNPDPIVEDVFKNGMKKRKYTLKKSFQKCKE